MTFKQTPRNAAHDFGHTLGTNKNAREVRAFPDVDSWRSTQQGVKAVVMIPTIKDNAQQHTAGQGSGDGY